MQGRLITEIWQADLRVALEFVEAEEDAVFLAWVAGADICQDSFPGIHVGRAICAGFSQWTEGWRVGGGGARADERGGNAAWGQRSP